MDTNWKTQYTVVLNNGTITYKGDYKCEDCGWVSNDLDFFTKVNDNLYCSLHKG
jgi:hypothetical protein